MGKQEHIEELCRAAKQAARSVAKLSGGQREALLYSIAQNIQSSAGYILTENAKDLAAARDANVSDAFYDRLLLNETRIEKIAQSIEEIAQLPDPVGRIERVVVRPSGIRVGQMRVPIGVVAVIFESRPNVTSDIAALCIKSGNAAILRGGKESIYSNIAIHDAVTAALEKHGCPKESVTLIRDTDRELVPLLLKMNTYIDIVIPRGGNELIQYVTNESTIPVIKHDKGVCHTFVDESADPAMAAAICINAKVARPSACNSMETLLIHKNFSHTKELLESIAAEHVELRGCERVCGIFPPAKKAAVEDWDAEYLDLVLAVKIVDSLDEAMEHIVRHSSEHSETIVTNDHAHAERFLAEVDSAAVFVNASTRFHDGGEFGLGAEVGISTQKLHARGAMGIEGLTCLKYVVYGSGQVRV